MTQRENHFLQKHLETRKAFLGTWYELNIFDLLHHDKARPTARSVCPLRHLPPLWALQQPVTLVSRPQDPAQAELSIRHIIHNCDAAFRKVPVLRVIGVPCH